MISKNKTLMKYGYNPDELSPSSNKVVVCSCENTNCNADIEYPKVYAVRKIEKVQKEGKKFLCQKCSHSHRKNTHPEVKNEKTQAILPPEVDLFKTMEKFGINAEEISPWSRKRVVVVCSCGEESIPKRCNLNNNKSIKETGHYKCTGCHTKERRIGQKASLKTRLSMKKSQTNRRNQEKKSA